LGIHKPSHLRRTIFGPSSGGLYGSCVVRLVAKSKQLFRYITANDPSTAYLCNSAYAIFGPSGICKWEGLVIHTLWQSLLLSSISILTLVVEHLSH